MSLARLRAFYRVSMLMFTMSDIVDTISVFPFLLVIHVLPFGSDNFDWILVEEQLARNSEKFQQQNENKMGNSPAISEPFNPFVYTRD